MAIKYMSPRSGRILKENDTVVNQADMLEAIYNALVVNKDAGVSISGSLAKGPDGNDFVIIGFECRGRHASQPLASEWLGFTYWSVDSDPSGNAIEISNGTNWVVMV